MIKLGSERPPQLNKILSMKSSLDTEKLQIDEVTKSDYYVQKAENQIKLDQITNI